MIGKPPAVSHDRMERLIRAEAPRLFRVLMFLLRDEAAAMTIMRESFLEAARSGPSDSPRRLWLRIYADAARRVLQAIDIEERQFGDLTAKPGPDPSVIPLAVARLPATERLCLALCDVGQMTTTDAADVLGMKREDLRRSLHQARVTLCEVLHGGTA